MSDEYKELVTAIEELAQQVSEVADRGAIGAKPVDYAKVDRTIREYTAAIEPAAHQAILRSLDIDAPKVTIEAVAWSRVGRHEATCYTMAGPVEVTRSIYRRDGERNGKVVEPVSLRVGTVGDRWLPETARATAHHIRRGTPREAAGGLRDGPAALFEVEPRPCHARGRCSVHRPACQDRGCVDHRVRAARRGVQSQR